MKEGFGRRLILRIGLQDVAPLTRLAKKAGVQGVEGSQPLLQQAVVVGAPILKIPGIAGKYQINLVNLSGFDALVTLRLQQHRPGVVDG
jgi:hypothetical protein